MNQFLILVFAWIVAFLFSDMVEFDEPEVTALVTVGLAGAFYPVNWSVRSMEQWSASDGIPVDLMCFHLMMVGVPLSLVLLTFVHPAGAVTIVHFKMVFVAVMASAVGAWEWCIVAHARRR